MPDPRGLYFVINERQNRWWLYGDDRRLIELYNKSLNIVPLAELPHYRLTWDRNAPDYGAGILEREAKTA